MWRRLSVLAVLVLTFAGIVSVLQPSVALAYDPFGDACKTNTGGGSAADASVCKSSTTTNPLVGTNGTLTRVSNLLALIGGIIAIIMMLLGGFKYITSSGDSSSTASAKNTIIYGLVGLIVIIMARAIVSIIVTKL